MRRAVVIALILLVLGPAGARGATFYRSASDGALRTRCCCPGPLHERAPAAPPSELRAACCCTIITLAARDADVRGEPPSAPAPLMIALAVGVVAPAPPRPPADAAPVRAVTRGPPGASASLDLFVRHCSLLL